MDGAVKAQKFSATLISVSGSHECKVARIIAGITVQLIGRKPKIIPHIPGTLEQIADSVFAKGRAYIRAKKAERQRFKNASTSFFWGM